MTILQPTRIRGRVEAVLSRDRGGAALVVDTESAPCRYPAEVIDIHHKGYGSKFIDAARHRRGITGWVEKEGSIAVGDQVEAHLPPQRVYGVTAS